MFRAVCGEFHVLELLDNAGLQENNISGFWVNRVFRGNRVQSEQIRTPELIWSLTEAIRSPKASQKGFSWATTKHDITLVHLVEGESVVEGYIWRSVLAQHSPKQCWSDFLNYPWTSLSDQPSLDWNSIPGRSTVHRFASSNLWGIFGVWWRVTDESRQNTTKLLQENRISGKANAVELNYSLAINTFGKYHTSAWCLQCIPTIAY